MQVLSKTGMLVDGIFASEVWDSSGERIDIAGCDISEMEAGVGVANYEHRDDKSPGASANDVVGKIVFAKKIMKASDAEDDRQKEFWNKIKVPFIYGIVRLFDASNHPNAMALAAMIRDMVANDEKILVRFSIEGITLKRDGQVLARCIARDVALTIKPCNRTCDSGMLLDPVGDRPRQLAKGMEVEQDLPDGEFKLKKTRLPSGVIEKCVKALAEWAHKGCSGSAEDILKAEMGALAPEHLDHFMAAADELKSSMKKSEQSAAEPADGQEPVLAPRPDLTFDDHRAVLNVLGVPMKMRIAPKGWAAPVGSDMQEWEQTVENFIDWKTNYGDAEQEFVALVANAFAAGTGKYSVDFGGDGRLFADQMMKAVQENDLAGAVPPLRASEARLVAALAGSGNQLVPDQRLLGHLFEAPEGELVKYGILSDPAYRAVWAGIDKAFYRYHPAVVFVLQHPQFGAYLRRNPEHAILPAQWLLGLPAGKVQKAGGLFDMKDYVADVAEWSVFMGAGAACFLFYRHLANLAAAKAPTKFAKMISGLEKIHRLLKNSESTAKDPLGLGSDSAQHSAPESEHAATAEHGLVHNGSLSSSQSQLVHGADLSAATNIPPRKGRNTAFFAPHPTHGQVFVKKADATPALLGHKRELMYHNLAHEAFGLGHYLAKTAAAEHPVHGNLSVHEVVDGEHYKADVPAHQDAVLGLRKSGELDKLELMNHMMGNGDRHMGNFMVTPKLDTPIKLIDHDLAFVNVPDPHYKVPAYGRASETVLDQRNEPSPLLHPEAAKWLHGLDPQAVAAAVQRNGGSPLMAQKLAKRVVDTQNIVKQHGSAMARFHVMGKVHRELDTGAGNWFKMDSTPHGDGLGL